MNILEGLRFSFETLLNIFGNPEFFVLITAIIIVTILRRLAVPTFVANLIAFTYMLVVVTAYNIPMQSTIGLIVLYFGIALSYYLVGVFRR